MGVFMSSDEKKTLGRSSVRDYSKPLEKVGEALSNLSFGSITLTVHESRVVQVDVTERLRFND